MPTLSGELRAKPSSNSGVAELIEGTNNDAGTKELLAPVTITRRTCRLDKVCFDLDATMVIPGRAQKLYPDKID